MNRDLERLLSKVEVDPNSGCWLWTGFLTEGGYGQIGRGNNRGVARAHRYSWELHRGPIPPGLLVCHRCDTPACVNPARLFVGTHADNVRDMMAKGRRRSGEVAKNLRRGPHPELRGERAPSAVLNERAVHHIRRLEMSHVDYARLYGVTRNTIRFVQERKTWRHI